MAGDEFSQYWKTVVETMQDGLMVVDPEGIIVSVNEVMEEMTGYRREELVGHTCAELDCDVCFHSRQKGQAAGHHCELFHGGEVRRCRCSLRRKDGRRVQVLKNAAVLRDDQGEVIGGVETLTDLSEVAARDMEISRLRRELSGRDGFHGLVGRSPAMRRVFDLISATATSQAPVVIYGQSGAGKELVAGAIHQLGPRAKGPFIKVNCAALNESLLESELFGHVKGAFTGADQLRVGRFEAANGGDIFLDEIGDLPQATQVKLLRVLQEKEIERVGDHRPIKIDVRVITATNQDLQALMAQGRFRTDLYYRIAAIPIHLPPLTERREDIPLLIEHFLDRLALKTGRSLPGLSPEALELMVGHSWPGNVRELMNALEYAVVLAVDGPILPEHLPAQITGPAAGEAGGPTPRGKGRQDAPDLPIDWPGDERARIVEALKRTNGRKAKAAELLGISRVTLWKRLKQYGLDENN